MNVICTAIVNDKRKAENLCDCVKKLGITPVVSGETVCAEYVGNKAIGTELVELFKQYDVHGTFMLD